MAYREYVGSRYVPIFGRKDETTIEWDNSKPYEPLTIVLYQGNSYTSRQYVPIGIDINNGEYWATTGNYNAQIEQYRAEVAAFDNRINTLENAFPINTSNIADSGVTTNKIADDAITTGKIADSAVTTGKIADDAVTTGKIANDAVTTGKIADDAVTTGKIADNAVTTGKIADEAVTEDKISKDVLKTIQIPDTTIQPICHGYMIYEANVTCYDHPGAICEIVPSQQAVISSIANSDTGHFRTLSIQENTDNATSIISTTVGHANSICSDGTKVYVAPVWKYANGQQDANCIYELNTVGTYVRQISVPAGVSNIMAVSYDWAVEKFYVYAYSGIIYEFDPTDSTFTEVENTNRAGIYIQDFAVKNGRYYISSPEGYMCYGYIGDNGIYGYLGVSGIDINGTFNYLGELDGMEFDRNGNLLAIMHIDNTAEENNTCFVVSLPVDKDNKLGALFPYQESFSQTNFSQFWANSTSVLRPAGNAESPHKGITIRNSLAHEYSRWVLTNNATVKNIRFECDKVYRLHINSGCTLTITGSLVAQNGFKFTGTGTLRFPFPISNGNMNALSPMAFTDGLTVQNSGSNTTWASNTTTGTTLVIGGINYPNNYSFGTYTVTGAGVYIIGLQTS